MIDQARFRDAVASFASGVTVVTAGPDSNPVGFTVSAFASLSLDPPLVLVCIQKNADCYERFMQTRLFAISILAEDQSGIAVQFATKGIDKFEDVGYTQSESGCPLINGAVAFIECQTVDRLDGGDHTILVGQALAASAVHKRPLLHLTRRFGRFLELPKVESNPKESP